MLAFGRTYKSEIVDVEVVVVFSQELSFRRRYDCTCANNFSGVNFS